MLQEKGPSSCFTFGTRLHQWFFFYYFTLAHRADTLGWLTADECSHVYLPGKHNTDGIKASFFFSTDLGQHSGCPNKNKVMAVVLMGLLIPLFFGQVTNWQR